jgi:anti-sigma factor RsiW
MHIDEHMLAGYISGELSDEERAAVTQELIRDSALREWLHLATEALAAANEGAAQGPRLRLLETPGRPLPTRMREDRNSVPQMTHIRRAI